MGRFVEINNDGIKTYTLFDKNSIKNVLALQAKAPVYTFVPEEKSVMKKTFLDSNNLLASAGIVLYKVVEKNKANFVVEREKYNKDDRKSIIKRDEKIFVQDIGIKDSVVDHIFFLSDGIRQMFSTQFYIDLDNVLKMVYPTIEITSKKTTFKILSGKGFKGELIFEDISIKNNLTKRSASTYMLTVKQTSKTYDLAEFNELIENLEKFCNEAFPTNDSIYEIAERMTKWQTLQLHTTVQKKATLQKPW